MYQKFFDLERRPFSSGPDPASYFAAPTHERSLALLRYCLDDEEGLGVLLGRAGSGKTLLCHLLLDGLAEDHAAIFITNPHRPTVCALLQAILYDIGLPFDGLTEQELRLHVTDFLIGRFSRGQRTLICVDEAHHLEVAQLEELRLLTNLEGRRKRAVQVLLLGQLPLETTLRSPELEGLRQRIGAVARVEAFDSETAIEYIRALVQTAGGSPETIFTAEALVEIADRSGGIARRINQLCHRTLLLAYAHEAGTIDAAYVEAAAEQLFLTEEPLHLGDPRPTESVGPARREPEPVVAPKPAARPRPIHGPPTKADVAAKPMPEGATPEGLTEHAVTAGVVEVGADYPRRPGKAQSEPAATLNRPAAERGDPPSDDESQGPGISRLRQLYTA